MSIAFVIHCPVSSGFYVNYNKMDKYVRTVRLFSEKEKTITEIRNHLGNFLGGSVNLLKREDGLAVVTLNHEEKKNAMSGKMIVDLLDVVEELEGWEDGKGVILRGAGGNFCSGGDLKFAKATGTAEGGLMMSTFMHNVLNRFQTLPLISVALIEGIGALGGGAELSVACDFRIISEKCQGIGFVHAKMGIIPAWGGTKRLVDKIGYEAALDLLSTARISSPSECFKLGLAQEIIPECDDYTDAAISWLKKRIKFNTEVVRALKAASGLARDFPNSFEMERRIFAPLWGSPANKEALSKNLKHKVDNEDDKKY